MSEVPVKNPDAVPRYVGGFMIPPGETRILPAEAVPAHLRPEPVAPATPSVPEPDGFVPETLDGTVAEIRALLPSVPIADLDALQAGEEAGKNRKGVLEAIQEERLRRAAQDDLDEFCSRIRGMTQEELLIHAELVAGDELKVRIIQERLAELAEHGAGGEDDGQPGPE